MTIFGGSVVAALVTTAAKWGISLLGVLSLLQSAIKIVNNARRFVAQRVVTETRAGT